MSLASCKVFRPFLAASSARALAASARARSWSAVCKCMAGQRTNLSGPAFPSNRQAPHSSSLETEAYTKATHQTRSPLRHLNCCLQKCGQWQIKLTCCSAFPFSRRFFTSFSFPLISSRRSSQSFSFWSIRRSRSAASFLILFASFCDEHVSNDHNK